MKLLDYPPLAPETITPIDAGGPSRIFTDQGQLTFVWAMHPFERIERISIDDHIGYWAATVEREIRQVERTHPNTKEEAVTWRQFKVRSIHQLTSADLIACGNEFRELKAQGVTIHLAPVFAMHAHPEPVIRGYV